MKRSAIQLKTGCHWRKASGRAAELPTGEAFRSEWIDFQHGIRVGNIEPHERITQILKFHLEQRYHTSFVTDRWGRGVYWQWICWLPRANREAKPISHDVNFGCAKLFISADTDTKIFKSGLQIERGYAQGPEPYPGCLLKDDWDWHRLIKQCAAGSPNWTRNCTDSSKREGFVVEVGDSRANAVFTKKNFKSARQIRDAAKKYPKTRVGRLPALLSNARERSPRLHRLRIGQSHLRRLHRGHSCDECLHAGPAAGNILTPLRWRAYKPDSTPFVAISFGSRCQRAGR